MFLSPEKSDEYIKVISDLQPSMSEINRVSASLLKKVKDIVSVPLSILINFSSSQDVFKNCLKVACITSYHRAGINRI